MVHSRPHPRLQNLPSNQTETGWPPPSAGKAIAPATQWLLPGAGMLRCVTPGFVAFCRYTLLYKWRAGAPWPSACPACPTHWAAAWQPPQHPGSFTIPASAVETCSQ